MASILKIDVLEQRYANSGIYLSGRMHGPQGDIINNGRVVLPGNFEANTFNVLESLDANTINANTIFLGGINGKLEFDANTSTLKINNASLALQSDVSTLIENSYTKFTANSSITAGDLVSLLDNGKIEKTAEASVRTNSVGATTTFETNNTDNIYVQYDKTLNKVLVSYAVGSSSACYGVLGTVNADGSITFGTPLQITSQYNLMTGAIDPVQNRAVFTFLGDVYIAEISGNNLINLQSPITFDSSTDNESGAIYDPNSGKIIIAYRDSADSGRTGRILTATVTGNSISFGPIATFETSSTNQPFSLSIDNDTNKIIIGYSLFGGASAKCVIATITGTTITPSTPNLITSSADFVKCTYTSNNIVVATFRDLNNNNYGSYSIGQITGNSIAFGSPVAFNNAASARIGLSYDNVSERVAISYLDAGNNNYGTVKSGIIENGDITFEATDVFNSSASTYEIFSTVDTTYNRILIGFKNGATGPGRINVYSTFGTEYKDNVDNYIGIAKDSIAATQEGSVFIIGDIADNQTSLTENQIYYVDKTGSLTTSKTEYSIVGRAVSNTSIQLLDNKPTLLTDLNIIDGTNSQVLTTYGNGSFYFAAASDPIAVSKTNTTNAILSTVTNVNDFRFDSDSGFDVVDLGAGAVKIQMNSTFKTLKVSGQSDLVATGLDTLELIGSGITITTDAVANPKTLTFTGASTLTDLGITDGSANQVLITDGLGNYSFANAASGGASTLTDLGIADGESDQVLTTDGNGSFFFGHTLSVLNQDLIDGGEITQLRDCRTVIDLGNVDTRLGYAAPEGSKTVLLANDSTIVSSTSASILSESNGVVKLENVRFGNTVNFTDIANDSISGDKIDGGTISNFRSVGILDQGTEIAIQINSNDTVSFLKDVYFQGNNTIINTQTVEIEDKNIVLGKNAVDINSVDGAGITIFVGNNNPVITEPSISYTTSGDAWVINKKLDVYDSEKTTYSRFGNGLYNGTDTGHGIAIGVKQDTVIQSNNIGILQVIGNAHQVITNSAFVIVNRESSGGNQVEKHAFKYDGSYVATGAITAESLINYNLTMDGPFKLKGQYGTGDRRGTTKRAFQFYNPFNWDNIFTSTATQVQGSAYVVAHTHYGTPAGICGRREWIVRGNKTIILVQSLGDSTNGYANLGIQWSGNILQIRANQNYVGIVGEITLFHNSNSSSYDWNEQWHI